MYKNVKPFLGSLGLLILLNLLIKPVWIFAIDRSVQNRAGLSNYGLYFALMNMSMVFNFLLDLGITPFMNRALAANQQNATTTIQQALSYKYILSFVYTAAILLTAFLTGVGSWYMLGLMIILQILISILLFLRAGLTATGKFKQDAFISVLDKLLIIIIAGSWLYTHDEQVNMIDFVWLQILTSSVTCLTAYFFFQQKVPFSFAQYPSLQKETMLAGLPYALSYFFMAVLLRGDGFLVERLTDATQAGVYASAFRLVDAVNMMGFLCASFLVSYIAREGIVPHTEWVLRLARSFLLIPAVLIAVFGWIYADVINNFLYHTASAYTTAVIRILLLTLPALALIHIYGSVLTATGNIKILRNASGGMAGLFILTDLFLIPKWGVIGAAWTAVVFESLFALLLMGLVVKRNGLNINIFDLLIIAAIGLALWLGLNS